MLTEAGSDLWIAEAPLRYLGFEVGRRMAVIRLADGGLWVHSPVTLSEDLRGELNKLGEVRFIVPASDLHGHLYMEQYVRAYPAARLMAAPGLARKRTDLDFDADLSSDSQPEWSGDLAQTTFEGHLRRTELKFLHRKTRTLITGDLCLVSSSWPWVRRLFVFGPWMRARLGPPIEFRLAVRDRKAARQSIARILQWDFDRILPGHGEIIDAGGKQAFADGFAWLMR